MEPKRMSMEERIQAFYRQSGGPNNPQIPELLEKHLLYGKDHGMDGYKETFEDAVMDTVLQDPSLLLLYERFQRWRLNRDQERNQSQQLEETIKGLEREVRELKEKLNQRA
ncbi:MAG: hypothetical protein M0Z65_01670 [Firmicutes bacterium]|nr:hypothetical protein [Melghirimyces thermohalophilus]MDA8351907.1 hypothetical protein [Bacillota bacterium]